MPIKPDWEDWPVEWPSEDMWKKFECELPGESEEEWGRWEEAGAESVGRGRREIRLHDCMWAGVCLSKDHKPPRRVVVALPRSVLRPPRPDTPQSEGEEAVSATEVTGQTGPHHRHRSDHDHDYDKAPLTTDDLGVQTPSDSEEEEIDVVSVRGSVLPCRLLNAASEAVSRRLRRPGKRKEPSQEEEYVPPVRPRKRPSPKKSSRFSTDSETESTERRSLHNNMERMRRIDLRKAFEELRGLVPGLALPGRAAKVTILRDAAAYCHELAAKGNNLGATVAALRKKQQRLRADLSRLRRHLAANR